MTPFHVASRLSNLANRAATGEYGAQAELMQALPAVELFDEVVSEIFASALEPVTIKYLIDAYGAGITNLNPQLADLLIGRCST